MPTQLVVTRTEDLTPSLRRVWFHSEDLSAFANSVFTDRYVKLVFLKPGVDYPQPLDLRALRGKVRAEDMPAVRTYTALFPDPEAGTVAIDFVVHGDEGVAGPWAARAVPGDQLLANGPGGGYRPDPDADWHLLVGEAQEVMHGLRPHLLGERGLGRDQVSISGYWRRGRTEEGFREWKSELAASEQSAP